MIYSAKLGLINSDSTSNKTLIMMYYYNKGNVYFKLLKIK